MCEFKCSHAKMHLSYLSLLPSWMKKNVRTGEKSDIFILCHYDFCKRLETVVS
jgi:hypothetical protein